MNELPEGPTSKVPDSDPNRHLGWSCLRLLGCPGIVCRPSSDRVESLSSKTNLRSRRKYCDARCAPQCFRLIVASNRATDVPLSHCTTRRFEVSVAVVP